MNIVRGTVVLYVGKSFYPSMPTPIRQRVGRVSCESHTYEGETKIPVPEMVAVDFFGHHVGGIKRTELIPLFEVDDGEYLWDVCGGEEGPGDLYKEYRDRIEETLLQALIAHNNSGTIPINHGP